MIQMKNVTFKVKVGEIKVFPGHACYLFVSSSDYYLSDSPFLRFSISQISQITKLSCHICAVAVAVKVVEIKVFSSVCHEPATANKAANTRKQ